jgi:hypothetical protein
MVVPCQLTEICRVSYLRRGTKMQAEPTYG